MKSNSILIKISFLLLSIIFSHQAKAHCEIPCGIYEDSLRIQLISEHIITIEKSINQIIEISSNEHINYNQLVRWINNKEEHANKIQDLVSQYFLNQRIKITEPNDVEAYSKYTYQLSLLHKLLVYSMKTKQSTDIENINKLKETVQKFSDSYFNKHMH